MAIANSISKFFQMPLTNQKEKSNLKCEFCSLYTIVLMNLRNEFLPHEINFVCQTIKLPRNSQRTPNELQRIEESKIHIHPLISGVTKPYFQI